MGQYTLPLHMSVGVQISFVDAQGKPTKVETCRWDTIPAGVIDIDVDPIDKTKAVFKSIGLGSVDITAVADVIFGVEYKELKTPITVEVVSTEAVAGTFSVFAPPVPISIAARPA